MSSLRDLQTGFAAELARDPGPTDQRIGIYRTTVTANFRNALGATYPVVRQLVGASFFNTAVDAYVRQHPSIGGDLNVYGSHLGDFLANYPHANELPYLPDVARLEWAIDEANRAADVAAWPEDLIAALAAIPSDKVPAQSFLLDPSCRLVTSRYPLLRIWQVHQPRFEGAMDVIFGEGIDWLLVRRESGAVIIERLEPGDFALLFTLHAGGNLGAAVEAAIAADSSFVFSLSLTKFIACRTLAALRRG
ncbi:MAG: DNA-binding domain-containing protein [Betaproteobacteria bacterium]